MYERLSQLNVHYAMGHAGWAIRAGLSAANAAFVLRRSPKGDEWMTRNSAIVQLRLCCTQVTLVFCQ